MKYKEFEEIWQEGFDKGWEDASLLEKSKVEPNEESDAWEFGYVKGYTKYFDGILFSDITD